jgi:hypothetical protein
MQLMTRSAGQAIDQIEALIEKTIFEPLDQNVVLLELKLLKQSIFDLAYRYDSLLCELEKIRGDITKIA